MFRTDDGAGHISSSPAARLWSQRQRIARQQLCQELCRAALAFTAVSAQESLAQQRETILRIHGSNMVGAQLAPDLAAAFLRSLAISDGGPAVRPTVFTVATEDYPVSRRLHLYIPAVPKNSYTQPKLLPIAG